MSHIAFHRIFRVYGCLQLVFVLSRGLQARTWGRPSTAALKVCAPCHAMLVQLTTAWHMVTLNILLLLLMLLGDVWIEYEWLLTCAPHYRTPRSHTLPTSRL